MSDLKNLFINPKHHHRFSLDLPRFQHERANAIFRHFINMPSKVVYDGGSEFVVTIRKRAHTPILMGVQKLIDEISVPWLDSKKLRFQWAA